MASWMRLLMFVALLSANIWPAHAGPYADTYCPGTGWPDWQCKAFGGGSGR